MIARTPLLFLLLIILPDIYIDLHYLWRRWSWWKRLLWWLPATGMTVYTVVLALERNFTPDDPTILYIYLLLSGLLVIPKALFAVCSLTGLSICRLRHKRNNYGNLVGILAAPVIWYILIYGSFVGFQKLEVNRQEYHCAELPAAFNGYRIVLFSDAHVGTYKGNRQWMLKRAVDSINALRPDMIVFTGDLQNIQPQELYEHMDLLASLKARDGVYSVLGNHDYAKYVDCDDAIKAANCRETINRQRQMGWTLLLNEHRTVDHNGSHLIIAGMENDGDGKRFPQKGDIKKTLEGVQEGDFIVMLEHDPSSWRRNIIPDGRAQLTLSGHTHAMQFSLFGWCPMTLTGKEVNGWYRKGRQSLFVTAGLGGLIPFRFGATGEIVVIELKISG